MNEPNKGQDFSTFHLRVLISKRQAFYILSPLMTCWEGDGKRIHDKGGRGLPLIELATIQEASSPFPCGSTHGCGVLCFPLPFLFLTLIPRHRMGRYDRNLWDHIIWLKSNAEKSYSIPKSDHIFVLFGLKLDEIWSISAHNDQNRLLSMDSAISLHLTSAGTCYEDKARQWGKEDYYQSYLTFKNHQQSYHKQKSCVQSIIFAMILSVAFELFISSITWNHKIPFLSHPEHNSSAVEGFLYSSSSLWWNYSFQVSSDWHMSSTMMTGIHAHLSSDLGLLCQVEKPL